MEGLHLRAERRPLMSLWRTLVVLGLAVVAAAPAAAAGPYLITDLNAGRNAIGSLPLPTARPGLDGVELGGFLYFTADDGMHGRELWRSDGTGAGTQLVRDICPGPCSSQLSVPLTVFGVPPVVRVSVKVPSAL